MTINPVSFRGGRIILLDQRKIPEKKVYVKISSANLAAEAIRAMIVRGAPAIGVAAAYGMVLGVKHLKKTARMLIKSRPTAVNLKWTVEKMLDATRAEGSDSYKTLLDEAKKIDRENKVLCEKISSYGATLIKNNSTVMTHCNAGALATGGKGTALGVIYEARKKIKNVYVRETRPRLQGAKLTCWELREWKIPHLLITDSMAAHIMKTEKIDAVIVGADRIASNGDTANKIGTYSLAICAKYHKVPFYVAAPYSTIDFNARDRKDIVIERRSQDEVLKINGHRIAARGTRAVNPAFDITPSELITAIITEKGVIKNPDKQKLKKIYGK